MAKQTFTTGQVLTSAQQNTLQTNDFNQTVSAKVASYVLVAADAGTRITMSNAAATTITVNTGLFAAGDTLQITNIGAGVCTITAGTATVSTAGVFTLAQNASGTLYFTSTGVSIFDGTAASSALSSYSLLATTTVSTAATTISGLSGYNSLYFMGSAITSNSNSTFIYTLNADSAANYGLFETSANQTGAGAITLGNVSNPAGTFLQLCAVVASAGGVSFVNIEGANTSGKKLLQHGGGSVGTGTFARISNGVYNSTSVISSITFTFGAGTVFSGTIYTYGSVS